MNHKLFLLPLCLVALSGITLAGYLVLNKTDNEIKPLNSNNIVLVF